MTGERPDFVPYSLTESSVISGSKREQPDLPPMFDDSKSIHTNSLQKLLSLQKMRSRSSGELLYPALEGVHLEKQREMPMDELYNTLNQLINAPDTILIAETTELKTKITPEIIALSGIGEALRRFALEQPKTQIYTDGDGVIDSISKEGSSLKIILTYDDAIDTESNAHVLGYTRGNGVFRGNSCVFVGEAYEEGIYGGFNNKAYVTGSSTKSILLHGGERNFVYCSGDGIYPRRLYANFATSQHGHDCFIALTGQPETAGVARSEDWITVAQNYLQAQNYAGSVLLRDQLIYDRGEAVEL